MQIESVAIADLVFDPANARKHEAKNLDAIKGSLARFGQQKPIVVGKKGVIIAGNGTLAAARSLGWDKIDVVYTELTGTDATAFAIADNRTSELAEWDAGILSETLKSLQAMDFDLGSIGFDAGDLAALIATPEPAEGLTDPDAVPENVETRCKTGDLWVLGTHRLLCGDSTNVQHVERLMGGEKADMVFTDPPYRLTGGGCKGDFVNSGWMAPDKFKDAGNSELFEVPEFADWMALLPAACSPDAELFVMSNVRNTKPMMTELERVNAKIHNILVMRKDTAFPHVWYSTNTEFALYYYFGKARDPIRKCQSNVFDVKMPRGDEKNHVSQKPVEFIAQILGNHRGENVLDLFLGSGSTLIACEKTGRRCFGMEIDPKYCDVILSRWEQFTGKVAALTAAEPERHV